MKTEKGSWRAVYSVLWDDPNFQALSPEAKLTFLNLRTGTMTNMICVFPLYLEVIRRQTGLSDLAIKKSLETLRQDGWIAYGDGYVWIKKGLRFDPNVRLNNEKHVKAIKDTIKSLPKIDLIKEFIAFYNLDIDYTIDYGIGYSIAHSNQGIRNKEEGIRNKDTTIEDEKNGSLSPTQILDLYNQICTNLLRSPMLSQIRERNIRRLIKLYPEKEFWETLFTKANAVYVRPSERYPKGWRPDLEFMTRDGKDENLVKILEGRYSDGPILNNVEKSVAEGLEHLKKLRAEAGAIKKNSIPPA